MAEQAANLLGVVVVIDMEAFPACSRLSATADRTAVALVGEYAVVFSGRQSIPSLALVVLKAVRVCGVTLSTVCRAFRAVLIFPFSKPNRLARLASWRSTVVLPPICIKLGQRLCRLAGLAALHAFRRREARRAHVEGSLPLALARLAVRIETVRLRAVLVKFGLGLFQTAGFAEFHAWKVA